MLLYIYLYLSKYYNNYIYYDYLKHNRRKTLIVNWSSSGLYLLSEREPSQRSLDPTWNFFWISYEIIIAELAYLNLLKSGTN